MGTRLFQSLAWLTLALLSGCAVAHPDVDRALLTNTEGLQEGPKVAGCYAMSCPDVIDVLIPGRPESSGRKTIGVDGRIDLGPIGRLLVQGQSAAEVAKNVATLVQLPADQIQVEVKDYRSQQVYLFGQVNGMRRAVAYRGPETVLELLRRTGGITAGAEAEDVYVIRSRLVEGRAPEVFHVDLKAIVLDRDMRTNIRLEPSDQVYVGQNRRSTLERCVPPCLQPLYEMFCGLYRPEESTPTHQSPDDRLDLSLALK